MYGKPRGTSRPNNYDVFAEDPENLVKQGNVVKEYNKFYQPQYAVRFIPDRSESAAAFAEAFGNGVGIGPDGKFSEANITPEQRARMVAFYNNPDNYGLNGVMDPNPPSVPMIRTFPAAYDQNTNPNLTGNYGEHGRYEKFRQEQLAKRQQEMAANPLTREEAMRTGRVGEWMSQEQKAYAQQSPVRPQQPVSLPLQVMPVAQPEAPQGGSPIENALLNAITRQMEGPRGRWVMSGNAPQAVRAQFHEMRAQDDRGGPGLDPQLVGAAADFARLQAAREAEKWKQDQADAGRPFGILEAAAGLSGIDPDASRELMQRGMDMLRGQGQEPQNPQGGDPSAQVFRPYERQAVVDRATRSAPDATAMIDPIAKGIPDLPEWKRDNSERGLDLALRRAYQDGYLSPQNVNPLLDMIRMRLGPEGIQRVNNSDLLALRSLIEDGFPGFERRLNYERMSGRR